jgi:hypothetical protein
MWLFPSCCLDDINFFKKGETAPEGMMKKSTPSLVDI